MQRHLPSLLSPCTPTLITKSSEFSQSESAKAASAQSKTESRSSSRLYWVQYPYPWEVTLSENKQKVGKTILPFSSIRSRYPLVLLVSEGEQGEQNP